MSVVLGINAFHAGASAAIVVDGVPRAAIAEERLNRIKHYALFPRLAIRKCLEIAGLEWSDIDHVAVGRDPSANAWRKIRFALGHPSRLRDLAAVRRHGRSLAGVRTLMALECGVEEGRLRFATHRVEHHLAHTASAYFISEWDDCAAITVDGSGDFVSCLMSECRGPRIRPLGKIFMPHSLGNLYTAVCQFIGYGRYGDEGKVMGLAPLGEDRYRPFLDRIVRATRYGFELEPSFFMPFGADGGMEIDHTGEMLVHRQYSDRFVRTLGEPRRRGGEITERDRDLACGVQRLFERYYLHLLRVLHRRSPGDRVALAGGCVLNSVANGKVFAETPFVATCIQPAAGDDGLALGAALYAGNALLDEGRRWSMEDAYLGEEFSDAFVASELERLGLAGIRLDRERLLDRTAEALARGDVVGWFQGRMEWGPRALGNRSILAHPGLPGMKDVLNARVKHREPFRPFAPSILAERQNDLFEQSQPSPFMTHVYAVRPAWRERLSAVTHVDGTGRPQTVTRRANPLYYDLIARFEERTGIPAILNTSFNENEPIVCAPAEAIDCFERTRMDVLVIGSHFCRKGGRAV
ncbi:MAG: carbamoyltransferase C-terminal domain-containing protein [Thermoanaerobaculia bacterium]